MVPWGFGVMLICLFLGLTEEENLPRAVLAPPENLVVSEGETALLRCSVENGSSIVQWAKDGLLLGPNPKIPGFPRYSMVGDPSKGEHNLQIARSQLEDDALYECQVGPSERSSAVISQSVLLSVLVPPRTALLTEYQANSTVTWVAGMDYTVNCQVKDARPAAEIAFSKGDDSALDAELSTQPGSKDKLFSTEAVLRIIPQSSDNRKWLMCRASNTASLIPAAAGFAMNVLFSPDPPVISGYKGPVVKAKDKLKLTCISLGGNPLATLQWLKNGEVISTNWETDDANQLSRSFLTLSLAAEDNNATVTCQALNQVLSLPLQASFTLHVVFFPEEVKIIGSSSTPESKEISLSCSTSSSNPPVQLRWWLGWRELNATEVTLSEGNHGGKVTVSNLTYRALREDNDLQLTCEAFNEAILYAKKASVTLKVLYPPQKIWIDVPPPETRFRVGTQVKLTCFASGGNPLPRLDWFKDNKIVRDGILAPAGPSGNIVSKELLLTTTPSDNMATYRCNASSPSEAPPLVAFTRLHIQFPPLQVTISTTSKEVRRNQTLKLTCRSGSSNPPATLTWLKDGKKLNAIDLGQKKAEYGGFSASSQVVLVAYSANHGQRVECHAFSSVLSEGVNAFYQLNILFPPEFSAEQPRAVQVAEYETVRLPLLVSASPPEITYRWSFLGEVILTEGSPRYHLGDGGSLEISKAIRADSGQYSVHCENSEGYSETTILLDVQYAPSIRSIGDPTTVDLGGTAEIVCQAEANPAPVDMFKWRWLGDLERSLEEMGIELLSEGLVGRLRIQEATRAHAGLYECQVDNGISPAARSSARLVVQFPPEIMKSPGRRKVGASGDGISAATLLCHAEGIPPVEFSWAKKGATLDFQNPRYTVLTEHKAALHTGILTIANASSVHDFGLYTCVASNAMGTDTLDIQLLSIGHPDPPTHLKVLAVSHNWLALEWTPGFDGGLDQSFHVRYHRLGSPSFLEVDVFPPQSPTFTLTGLHPNTPYNVSVHARNALGESGFADGVLGLIVTTTEREKPMDRMPQTPPVHGRGTNGEPTEREPQTPPLPGSASPALPLFLIELLGAVGGILIISSFSLLGFLFCRRQAQALEGEGTKAGAVSKERRENNYSDNKWLRFGARLVRSEEHSSETSMSPRGSSVTTRTSSMTPSRPWSQLGHHAESEMDASIMELPSSPPWLSFPELHEYEEVMVPPKDKGKRSLYSAWYPEEAPWIPEYEGPYQQRRKPSAGYEEITPIYDPVAEWPPFSGDRTLPFEHLGELV
ncbi:LOW QUALITY PROTEIN: nephrin [Paroedura picta]|uniref:LOW QUALITY PROTEIN: nephrin n=1 Tax=Paroedura picta TaxID=143630 RepID=UPI004057865E